MSDVYRIFGAENSPFSVKVRSYFRYKGIPHEWIVRSQSTMAEYQKYAKLPIIPLLVTPNDEAVQDSTPILELVESLHPDPSIHPPDEATAFLSALLEEFGDEWGNKWMLHYRWAREADQQAASRRLVSEMMPDLSEPEQAGMAKGIADRMVGRVWFVGSNEITAAQIEDSWREGLGLLEDHLATRSYLFGARPAFADFGLWGQIYNASLDPTPGDILRAEAPCEGKWVARMLDPKAEGEFEMWESLAETLSPLLKRLCGDLFLPWSDANARALAGDLESYDVQLDGRTWTQKPVKYQAKSLAAIQRKYRRVQDRMRLDPVLQDTGCVSWLSA